MSTLVYFSLRKVDSENKTIQLKSRLGLIKYHLSYQGDSRGLCELASGKYYTVSIYIFIMCNIKYIVEYIIYIHITNSIDYR